MALRTTEAAVQSIMPEYPDVLLPFLTDANLLVTEELADAGMSDERLETIERYLSAHFASIYEPLVKQEGVSGVQASYQRGLDGKALESTQYGQQAIMWDSSGRLLQLSKGRSQPTMFEATQESWQSVETTEG